MAEAVRTVELRVLEGPNLYFPRPAVKLMLEVGGWLRASDDRVQKVARSGGHPEARTGYAPEVTSGSVRPRGSPCS